MSETTILIFDVGKSHSKVSLVNLENGSMILSNRCQSVSYQSEHYLALDVETIWQWLLQQLIHLSRQYLISQIIVTTHGAAAAVIDEKNLIFPVVDYEFDGYHEINKDYQAIRPKFYNTGSLDLPMGLNLGRQLYWLQQRFPEQWSKAQTILMLPQYFCWKLTGRAVSELTSLGCHTDIWDYREHCFSSLTSECNWQKMFPEMAGCGEELGTISAEISASTGLTADTVVLNGIHDSNASLVPYLQAKAQPINVISSGTWTVICSLGGDEIKHQSMSEMMISMSYQGEAVPSMRFMGGREWNLLQPQNFVNYTIKEIRQLVKLACYPLPAFAASGSFSESKGIIIGEDLLSAPQRSAVGTLYLALMTRYCLDMLGNQGEIIIEGSFIDNIEYLQLLQSLSPAEQVFVSEDASGTTLGAARLSSASVNWPKIKLAPVEAVTINGIDNYYKNWCARIKKRPNQS